MLSRWFCLNLKCNKLNEIFTHCLGRRWQCITFYKQQQLEIQFWLMYISNCMLKLEDPRTGKEKSRRETSARQREGCLLKLGNITIKACRVELKREKSRLLVLHNALPERNGVLYELILIPEAVATWQLEWEFAFYTAWWKNCIKSK